MLTSTKPPKCPHCKERLPSINGPKIHPDCFAPWWEAYSAKQQAKKAKAEKAADKAKREGMKTIPQLIAAAQIAFNAYIRERDKDKGCFVCNRPFMDVVGRVQHAGHVRSRGAAGHLRFNEDNCHGECEGCNGPHGAKPHQIKAGAIARIGQERFDALEADNEPIKWTREVLRQIKTIYMGKTRELRKER